MCYLGGGSSRPLGLLVGAVGKVRREIAETGNVGIEGRVEALDLLSSSKIFLI